MKVKILHYYYSVK